jgi:flavin reductase (DIM6/NTAB) family NADH-FMN oxidoreductase RutF
VIDKQALKSLDKRQRIALVNSLPGFKPVVLVGSVNENSRTNLCVINSCFHVGADPALMGMIIRPAPEGTERHTLENILATKTYSVNAVTRNMARRAHHTSARFSRDQSEFSTCDFLEQWHEGFSAPFVSESPLQLGLTLAEHLPLTINGTHLIIGSIELINLPAGHAPREDGSLDLQAMDVVAGVGLDAYHAVNTGQRYSYAKPDQPPELI